MRGGVSQAGRGCENILSGLQHSCSGAQQGRNVFPGTSACKALLLFSDRSFTLITDMDGLKSNLECIMCSLEIFGQLVCRR